MAYTCRTNCGRRPGEDRIQDAVWAGMAEQWIADRRSVDVMRESVVDRVCHALKPPSRDQNPSLPNHPSLP